MLLGLLKFIFWFFLVSYVFKMVFRFLAPILMNQFVKKMKNKYTQQYDYQRKSEKKEGDITIKNSSNSKKKNKTKIGEYIDFEELE